MTVPMTAAITPEYALTMARYNHWQNQNLLTAASTLSDAERAADRGAFFGSILKTFSHLFWADQIWFNRFSPAFTAPEGGIPTSTDLIDDWEAYCTARGSLDLDILAWAKALDPAWLEGDLSWYSGAAQRDITKPRAALVMQVFNHQTHHRGQIHAMLTAAGARPSDTDIPFMPEPYLSL